MEATIPMSIPAKMHRSISSKLNCQASNSVIVGSFFSASSVNHPRNSVALSVPVNDPCLERKLSRTRKMSEAIRSVESKRMTTIPTEMEDITLPWVVMLTNQYLLKQGQSPLASDMELEFHVQDCKSSVGEFSSTYRIDAMVPNQMEFSFIVKMIPDNDPCRAYVFDAGLFEKENEMYFDVLPAIKFYMQSQKQQPLRMDEGGTASSIVDKLIPECIYGSHNMDGAGVLVFQCCAKEGFHDCEDPYGLKIEQMRSVIKSLAEFHAVSRAFVLKYGEIGVQRRYPSLSQDMYSNGMLLKEITDCMEAYELFMDSVSQSASAASQVGLTEDDLSEMRRQFEKLKCCDPFLLLQNLRRPSKQGNLTTIIHGEMWEKNILLDANYNAKILDWKNAKLASATLDLAFFLLSSTNWDVRVEGTKNLLLSYHEVYCKTITKLCPQIPEPTYEDLEEDYYISIQYATLQALCLFVQEMHFITQAIAKATLDENHSVVDDLSDKLKIYEIRALTLLKDLDLSQIEEDLAVDATDDETGDNRTASSFEEEFR